VAVPRTLFVPRIASVTVLTAALVGGGQAWGSASAPTVQRSGLSGAGPVACATSGVCMTTGDGYDLPVYVEGGQVTVGSRQQGPSQENPGPLAVACPTANLCEAAGFLHYVAPVQLQSSGLTPQPAVAMSSDVSFSGIACPTASMCVVAGDYASDKGAVVEVQVIGSQVTFGKLVKVPGTYFGSDQVVCPTATLCIVAGATKSGWKGEGVVVPVELSGSTLSVGAVQTVSATSQFNGVACATTTSCVAVGVDFTSSGQIAGVAAGITVNGTAVTVSGAEILAGRGTWTLNQPACPTSTLCVANGLVGTGRKGVMVLVALHVTKSAPTFGKVVKVRGSSDMFGGGLACPTSTTCIATGYEQTASGKQKGVIVSFTPFQ
jgi:hypothetical protein